MSLKFLNLKGFHPSNKANQKRIWVAEQKAKAREQREAEAAREVRKNADTQRFQQLAAAKGDAEAARRLDAQQVGFLYAPPPGLQKAEAPAKDGSDDAGDQVAEDDAVREFRRKMEKRRGAAGADDVRRNLERYVGRRPDEPLTIKDQVERFPFLKDAPVEGDYTDSVKVNFKPVGKQLRNVRCLRCGQWGHQSGDRECEMRDFNPHDAARQAMEDPMTYFKSVSQSVKQQLVLRRAALPLEMQGEAATDEFTILPSDDEDPEREFLASLSTKEKKRLLKKLKEQAVRHHDDSSDSSDSSSSDSNSSSDRCRRRRHKRHGKKKKEKKRSREHRHSRSHLEDEDDKHRGRRHRHERETASGSSRRDDDEKPSRKRRDHYHSRSRSERRHRHRQRRGE